MTQKHLKGQFPSSKNTIFYTVPHILRDGIFLLKKLRSCDLPRATGVTECLRESPQAVVFVDCITALSEAMDIMREWAGSNTKFLTMHSRQPVAETNAVMEKFREIDEGYVFAIDMLFQSTGNIIYAT